MRHQYVVFLWYLRYKKVHRHTHTHTLILAPYIFISREPSTSFFLCTCPWPRDGRVWVSISCAFFFNFILNLLLRIPPIYNKNLFEYAANILCLDVRIFFKLQFSSALHFFFTIKLKYIDESFFFHLICSGQVHMETKLTTSYNIIIN